MAAARKRRVQESLHHFDGLGAVDHPAAHRQHICVVVLPRQPRRVHVVRHRGANARHLIRRDRNAHAGAAQGDAIGILMRSHAIGYRLAVVGVVHGFLRPRTQVIHGIAGIFKELADGFFNVIAGMIGAQGDPRLR